MWGLFALRTRHPPPCSPSVYRGSTRGAGEEKLLRHSVPPPLHQGKRMEVMVPPGNE